MEIVPIMATAPLAATPRSPSAAGIDPRWLGFRFWLSPLVIAAIAAGIGLRIGTAELIAQDISALDWSGKILPQIQAHVGLSLASAGLATLIGLPCGVMLTRPRLRGLGGAVLVAATIGQAVPAFGLFVIMFTLTGPGFWTAVYALTLFAVLPVMRNTVIGIAQVDRSATVAARGMGMGAARTLFTVELPLAIPVIIAGIRTALVCAVGMATLAFLIGGGGLGETIDSGLRLQRDAVVMTGAGLAGIIALTFDWLAVATAIAITPWDTDK